jgi:hypothetical protein
MRAFYTKEASVFSEFKCGHELDDEKQSRHPSRPSSSEASVGGIADATILSEFLRNFFGAG